MNTHLIKFHWAGGDSLSAAAIKDPAIARMPDGGYMMYATISDSSSPGLKVKRFHADHPGGPWKELGLAKIHNLEGPEICAPAVFITQTAKGPLYTMYIQTACFSADGVITRATSTDGENFYADPVPVMTKNSVSGAPHKLIGLYDVAISDITRKGIQYECMTFSGYREVGSGDIYMALRPKNAANDSWTEPKLVLSQEDVPFHNRPGSKNFEWGLEGAKIVQLDENVFVLIGVCFLDKDVKERGTRQRVFMAAAQTPQGPFLPMDMPFPPVKYAHGEGENGHPDMLDLGNGKMAVLYQERAGDGENYPWHLRYAELDKNSLLLAARNRISPPAAPPAPKKQAPRLK